MLFNSYIFIFLFLPLCLAGWYILNRRGSYTAAKAYLTGMSLWFYGYFNPMYLILMISSVLVNYLFYRLIVSRDGRSGIIFLIPGIIFDLGLLFYFKYYDFFAENINRSLSLDLPIRNILLPLGISFFTFQQLGFLIDSYRGETKGYVLLDYALFVCFFPQLVAGPIVSHDEMITQFNDKERLRFSHHSFAKGMYAFTCGLGKKLLLADVFGRAVDLVYSGVYFDKSAAPGGIMALLPQEILDFLEWRGQFTGGPLLALLVIIAYSLQLYYDFSGYCDMARGIGWMFNIDIPVNFDSPYRSKGPGEFWRRWHMTLGRFLGKYVYIPLGGSRCGLLRTCINIMIVFTISGIWHGAAWTFVIWGVLHGIWRVLEVLWDRMQKGRKSTLLTFIMVSLLWCIFRAESTGEAISILQGLFDFSASASAIPSSVAEMFRTPEFFYILKVMTRWSPERMDLALTALYMAAGLLIVFLVPSLEDQTRDYRPDIKKSIFTALIFLWSVVSLSGVSTFLYFNF